VSPRPEVVVGLGTRTGADPAVVLELLDRALSECRVTRADVVAVATVDARAGEPALTQLAALLAVPLLSYPAEQLNRVAVPTPSTRVAELAATASVAEAAALIPLPIERFGASESIELILAKTGGATATIALARHRVRPPDGVDLHHHGDAEVAHGLLDLAVNVHAAPSPDWLQRALVESLGSLAAYPDARRGTEAIARRHGRPLAEVLLTAGAAEAFTLIAQALAAPTTDNRAVVVHPQFTEPEVALRAAGWEIERAVLSEPEGFALNDDLPIGPDLVMIGNPTNPTGVLHSAERLWGLRPEGGILVVDEAFMDTVEGESESLASSLDLTGVLVVRSLTKTWGLAGLRVGYVLGDAQLIQRLKAVQPHWSVSTPALAAVTACLSPHGDLVAASRHAAMRAERERLRVELRHRGFVLPARSEGSFLLTRHPHWPGVHEQLRRAGIAVRRADTFPGLGSGWIRIAVRDEAASAQLLGAIDEARS